MGTKPGKAGKSLRDYVVSVTPAPACVLCKLPPEMLVQLEEARKFRTASVPTMAAWLQSEGYSEVTKHKIEHHFRNGCAPS